LSLESGKKLGFIASIINIVVPVALDIVFVAFYATLFSFIITRAQNSLVSVTPDFSAVYIAMIAIVVVGAASALAGYILFLVAMYRLSKYYSDHSIFSNLIKALIIQIVTGIVLVVVVVIAVFFLFSNLIVPMTGPAVPSVVYSTIAIYAVVALIGYVISIYCAILYKRSFDRLAEKSGVDNFHTAGLLYLIGMILNIVAVGGIIVWIAWIFTALGYRKLQPLPAQPAPFIPPYQSGSVAVKHCPTCGADNNPDAIYCRNCGRLL
jgi:uncharacterized membrane protein